MCAILSVYVSTSAVELTVQGIEETTELQSQGNKKFPAAPTITKPVKFIMCNIINHSAVKILDWKQIKSHHCHIFKEIRYVTFG